MVSINRMMKKTMKTIKIVNQVQENATMLTTQSKDKNSEKEEAKKK